MKKTVHLFLVSFLCILFVLANIVAAKIIVILKLPISCSIIIYPLTFLCVLLINHLFGTKEAYKSVGLAILIQIIVWIFSIIICNLPGASNSYGISSSLQSILAPDLFYGLHVPAIKLIIGSLVAFSLSQAINIFLYSFAKKYTLKVAASFLALFFAIMVDGLIFTLITRLGVLATNDLMKVLLTQFIFRVAISIIIIIIFMVCTIKEKE